MKYIIIRNVVLFKKKLIIIFPYFDEINLHNV